MPIVDYPLFDDIEVVEPKVYIEDKGISAATLLADRRAPEWCDFTDKLGTRGGKDLLLKLSTLQLTSEKQGGVSFESNLSNISWYNGDRFWSRPFPIGTGTIYGRSQPCDFNTVQGNAAYFEVTRARSLTVLSGHRLKIAINATLKNGTMIETDIAFFFIDKMTRNSQSATASMKVVSIAQPLLKSNCDAIKDSGGWYRNRNIAFLVRKILEDQYRVADWNLEDPAAGSLPATFKIPERIILNTDAWEQEQRWRANNPSSLYEGPDSRTLSHYGSPPEWDGSRFHEDGLVTRCLGLWQLQEEVSSNEDYDTTLYFGPSVNLLPTNKMGPKPGDHIVIRESSNGNDGSYEIETIPLGTRCTIKGGLKGTAEISMKFTITVMIMGCDNELWEYNPETEQYTAITTPGYPNATLPNISIVLEDLTAISIKQPYRQIELNRNNRFVLIAWANPPYQEHSDTAKWDYEVHSFLQVALFYRNAVTGYYFEKGDAYNAFPGDLLLRAMQMNVWQHPEDSGDNNRFVFSRQAGQLVDTTDTWLQSVQSGIDHLRDSKHRDDIYLAAWNANRGRGVILPFAQKVWLLTQGAFGRVVEPKEVSMYPVFYGTQVKRDVAYPYDGAATSPPYPRDDTTVDASIVHMLPHEVIQRVVGSRWEWVWPENRNDSDNGIGVSYSLDNAEVVIAYRDTYGTDPYDESGVALSAIYSTLSYQFSNRVIPPGFWCFHTSAAERHFDNVVDQDWDQWNNWRLVIAHSWGSKGAVQFCDSTKSEDGVVIYPFLSQSDGPQLQTIALDFNAGSPVAASAALTESEGGFSHTRAQILPGGNGEWGDGVWGNSSTTKTGPFNSTQDSFDNNQGVTHPISSCADASGDYYYLSLRHAMQTNGPLDRAQFLPVEYSTVDIVTYDTGTTSGLVQGADHTVLYTHANDSTLYGTWTPVDIYYNPQATVSEALMIICRKDGDAFEADFYRLFFHSLSSVSDSLTPADSGDATIGTFPNKPMSLAFDAASGYWYGITAESGSLFKFSVVGPAAYHIEVLDEGWPAVQEEGYCNVTKLAIDSYTRRTPSLDGYTQFVALTAVLGWGTKSGPLYYLPVLHSDWTLENGNISHLSLNGAASSSDNTILRIENTGATTWLSWQGSPTPTEYEIRFKLAVTTVAGTPDWDDDMSYGLWTTGGNWYWHKGDFNKWSVASWPPGSGASLKAMAWLGGHHLVKAGSETTWDVQEVTVKCYMPDTGAPFGNIPEAWLLVDVRGDEGGPVFKHVGFRIMQRTAGNWTAEELRQDGGSFYSGVIHTFSGGALEFNDAPFRMKITRDTTGSPTNYYEYFVELPGVYMTDTWTNIGAGYASGFLTGGVGIGASAVEAYFDDVHVEFQGSGTVEGLGGIVYSHADVDDDNRMEVDLATNQVRVYRGGALGSTVIMPFTMVSGTYYSWRFQKDLGGNGLLKLYNDDYDPDTVLISIADTVGADAQHGPWANDGICNVKDYQVYGGETVTTADPRSRALVYGVSAPTFFYDFSYGDDRIAGKYFLWKYDVHYSSRITLADFAGLKQWKALQELARVSTYTMGFVLDDFFFVPRENSTDVDVLFRKHSGVYGNANVRKMLVDEGLDEIYNYASITPGLATLQQPSWNLILQNRTEEEFQDMQFNLYVEQRDTRQQNVRLICTRPGKLTPEQGDKVCPQFSYFVVGSQFETFLLTRKAFNVAPFEIVIAESITGMNTGDLIEINVENDNGDDAIITAEVDSLSDEDDGGHIGLTARFEASEDWPTAGLSVGTPVLIKTQGRWSSAITNDATPRFWPWSYDTDGVTIIYPGLQSGRLYRVGLTNLYLRISDLAWEQDARRFVRFLGTSTFVNQDEKELYVLAVKDLKDFRQGDVIEIDAPGMKLETGERLTQSAINLLSSQTYGKRQYPVKQMKFLAPKQARDMSRRVVRNMSYPKGIYTVTIGFNPLINFLDTSDRLHIFGIQDSDEFEYSPVNLRYGYPRRINHDPANFQTTVIIKDRDIS